MTPTTTQIAESKRKAEDYLREKYGAYRGHFAWRELEEAFTTGYIRARTEQSAEIAELKAKLAEVMPLAKFGATVLRTYAHNGDINDRQVCNAAMQTNCMHATKAFTVRSPNTIDTIIKRRLLTTHPTPFVPITADMVTNEMVAAFKAPEVDDPVYDTKGYIAAAVNAYLGAKK